MFVTVYVTEVSQSSAETGKRKCLFEFERNIRTLG